MKFFKWITGRSGKIALSAAQAVGLSAVVGVAGIAAWQYLDAPTDNNSFNLAGQYNPGEVVYVAGTSGGTYGSGGELQSAFMAKPSKAIEMTEKMTLAQQRAEEYDDSVVLEDPAPSNPQAYQMGGTEGLGMGANRANEEELKNNPMAFAQQSLAGVTDAISRAQKQAQKGTANGKQAAGGTLASANRDWGSSAATQGLGGGGGNSFNSSFAVQDSGKNAGGKGGAAGAMGNPAEIMKNFQAQVASAQEGARLRGRSNFGPDQGIGSGRDSILANARNSRENSDLEFIRKRSADAAKNRNRAANEGSRAFLASTQISGGMSIVGDNVTTGQGQSSADFNSTTDTQLRGIQSFATEDLEEETLTRQQAREKISTWMWIAIPAALAAMVAIPIAIASLGWFFGSGYALAAAIAAVALVPVLALLGVSIKYANNYGGNSLSTWGITIASILTAGLAAAFIPGLGFTAKLATWAQLLVGGAAAGLGAGAAWWITSGAEEGAVDTDSLNIGNDQGSDKPVDSSKK